MGERNAIVGRIEAEVEIAWQGLRRGCELVVIEYHREARKCRETFAADARGEVDAVQIDRSSANRTDTIEAKLHFVLGTGLFQAGEIVHHAGGRFAMCGPKPIELGRLLDKTLHRFKVEGLAPLEAIGLERETQAGRVV